MSDSFVPSVNKKAQLFATIGDNVEDESPVTVVESMCMNCHENGTTRIMLTLIPHFKEVILMCFECDHCGFKNNEVQTGSATKNLGSLQQCSVTNKADLNRQVVKSENAMVKFIELDFEIPAETQRGVLTTIEGLISKSIEGLAQMQPVRIATAPDLAAKVQTVLDTLQTYLDDPVANPFTVEINDPAGNSYIENLRAPNKDPQLKITTYKRTVEQNVELGLDQGQEEKLDSNLQTAEEVIDEALDDELANEVHVFHGNCSRCNAPSDTRMHIMDIPHFKEVVIMATDCEHCGYKSNEVKSGGAISKYGKKITLHIKDVEDLNRDILKSETCGLAIPEIELDLTNGTLGGRFTTVEGLLEQVYDEIGKTSAPFSSGDSSSMQRKEAFDKFLGKLKSVLAVEKPFTLILDDPLGNSYLQNIYAPDPDPDMTIESYERTYEQNEDYGLNDLVLENYGENSLASIEEAKKVEEAAAAAASVGGSLAVDWIAAHGGNQAPQVAKAFHQQIANSLKDPDRIFGDTFFTVQHVKEAASSDTNLSGEVVSQTMMGFAQADAKASGDSAVVFGPVQQLNDLLASEFPIPLELIVAHFGPLLAEIGATTVEEVANLPVQTIFAIVHASRTYRYYITILHHNAHYTLLGIDFTDPSAIRVRYGDSAGNKQPPASLQKYFHKFNLEIKKIKGFPNQKHDGVGCGVCVIAAAFDLWKEGEVKWKFGRIDKTRFQVVKYLVWRMSEQDSEAVYDFEGFTSPH
ncbi:hypothetical protein HDU98_007838 [Podochytrium sp. JEL0797]|nr:hypothetical protein HDU98_007838 [Podochytrium sp. JEL0797]